MRVACPVPELSAPSWASLQSECGEGEELEAALREHWRERLKGVLGLGARYAT